MSALAYLIPAVVLILGGAGLPDIGQLFPDADPAFAGADSLTLLSTAARKARDAGWRVGNLDCTVLLEKPRISARKGEIIANLAKALGVVASAVNVKGKSGEGVGPLGEGRAIETYAIALLVREGGPV